MFDVNARVGVMARRVGCTEGGPDIGVRPAANAGERP